MKKFRLKKIRFIDWMKAIGAICLLSLLVVLSELFQNVVIGEAGLAVFAVYALLLRVNSITSFIMAFITLFFTVLLNLLDPANELSDTFAVYTYLLFAIGMLCAVAELWREDHKNGKKYHRKAGNSLETD